VKRVSVGRHKGMYTREAIPRVVYLSVLALRVGVVGILPVPGWVWYIPTMLPGWVWWVYSSLYICTPVHPWVYHRPPVYLSVRASSPAHAEVPDDKALGSSLVKPMGERPLCASRLSVL